MKKSIWKYIVLSEVILSFAFPVHVLANGVVALPIWFLGAMKGAGFAVVHVLCIIGGCLGIWAVQEATRAYLAEWPVRTNWLWPLVCADIGVVSLWAEMTGQFTGFQLDWFSFLAAVVPTLCTIHIFVLAIRKSRAQMFREQSLVAQPDAAREGDNLSPVVSGVADAHDPPHADAPGKERAHERRVLSEARLQRGAAE